MILVLDADTPWIRSLFSALPVQSRVCYLGSRTVGVSLRLLTEMGDAEFVPVPGWTRAGWLSTQLTARAVRRRIATEGAPRCLVHTTPWTAGLLAQFPQFVHVYRPHDYFGMYDWDQSKVVGHERRLMAGCRLVTPISPAHADDLRALGSAPVHVLPNGVSGEFIRRLREPPDPLPSDLIQNDRAVVGCVGQINHGYDLPWLGELMDAVPEADFVFIGPIFDEGAENRRRIDEVLARRNARWLGPKPHSELPNYMRHFTVCLNPLHAIPANDRRSPLRLFDYLATDRPILSTTVAAARGHAPHVELAATADEAVRRLRVLLSPSYRVDAAARRDYLDRQTWDVRGREFLALLEGAT